MRYEKNLVLGIALSCMLLAVGCGASIMVPAQRVKEIPPGYALVTFIRATSFGGAIDFGIWDGENLVGVLDPKAYIQYFAPAGEHVFIARAENWSYVRANLEAGRAYHILANVTMGVWKARVVLRPIHANDTQYTKQHVDGWLASLRPTMPDPQQAAAYAQPRIDHIRQGIALYTSGQAQYEVLEATDYYR
jgi:hypothetical protein